MSPAAGVMTAINVPSEIPPFTDRVLASASRTDIAEWGVLV
jgi:hypothetical protein